MLMKGSLLNSYKKQNVFIIIIGSNSWVAMGEKGVFEGSISSILFSWLRSKLTDK